MKTKLILGATLGLNVVLAAMLLVPRGKPAPPAPRPSAAGSPTNSSAAPLTTTNVTTPVIPFHWRQVESEDYRRYIANLRALGCPERLIHDIILADIKKLYEAKERANVETAYEPWAGRDRRNAGNREWKTRRAALEEERRALIRELLGSEWVGRDEYDEWNDNETAGLLCGFLPEGVPAQLNVLTGRYWQLGQNIYEAAQGIYLDEDYAKVETLHAGFMSELAALLSPADFEELLLRHQYVKGFKGDEDALDGIEVSGAELRELMRVSLAPDDIYRDLFQIKRQDLPACEKERCEVEFEQKVAQILGPERFADYQFGKDRDYRHAFAFAREKKLSKSAARTVGRAMAGARQQLKEIKQDKVLTPDERQIAIAVLAAFTRNSVTAALGPAAATEYLKENGVYGLSENITGGQP